MEENFAQILEALYAHFESTSGSSKMPFPSLLRSIEVPLNNKERVKRVRIGLHCLRKEGLIEYQSLPGGQGGLACITPTGIQIAEDNRQLASFTLTEDDKCPETAPKAEPVKIVPDQQTETTRERLYAVSPSETPQVWEMPLTLPIPAGPFWMGSADDDPKAHDNEKPRKKLDLPEYRVGCYPVTNTQYARFVRDTGHDHPCHWDEGQIPSGLEDHPVVNVSFQDANAYCQWLSQITGRSCRLPQEEEWEKAARGNMPDTRRYPWGDQWQPCFCNTQETNRGGTTPVYEFEQVNQSPFGIVDMAANVWEWTTSRYVRYPNLRYESLIEQRLVVRGGSWRHCQWDARVSCRGRYTPDTTRPYLGFRIVLAAPLDRAELRQNLAVHFSLENLRTLCFDLEFDHENLPNSKEALARELVASCERRQIVYKLIKACHRQYPNVFW